MLNRKLNVQKVNISVNITITYFSCDWIGSILFYPRNNASENRREKIMR